METKILQALRQYFGYEKLRPGQEGVIKDILSGFDCLCVMPTGAGKSLCYELPALIFPGMTLVISPLIALMEDQCVHLIKVGISAAYISSDMSKRDITHILERCIKSQIKLLYISPERLASPLFSKYLKEMNVSFVCIDEAHCSVMWGREFRPSYIAVSKRLAALTPRPVFAAFTATADLKLRGDIIATLCLKNPKFHLTGVARQNLTYDVIRDENKFERLMELLEKYCDKCGIIYCRTRRAVMSLHLKLKSVGIDTLPYHAGLPAKERLKYQEEFLSQKSPLMVATCAFGMGIDKSDVRFVLHYGMPPDMESYYQEAGRAGRDGKKSECIILYSSQDLRVGELFVNKSKMRKDSEMRLRSMSEYASGKMCYSKYICKYFGEDVRPCGVCSACRKIELGNRPGKAELSNILYLRLKRLRNRISHDKKIRQKRIFDDSVLKSFSLSPPANIFEMLLCENVKPVSVIRYGKIFLSEINDHRKFYDI